LAERLNLGNAPADGTYVPLPPFLFLTGTLGTPDTDRNDVAIAGIVARGVLPNVGGDAGKILDALLKTPKGTNAASTNAPSTNKPANPLDRLLKNLPK